jgi:GTP-binding protein YchF
MSFQCGIVGLPNVGKSTLFNALTVSNVPTENYPFCTIEPHIGIVELPDPRLHKLANIYRPEKVIPATVEFIDIAGLVQGASRGEGLGNQFLGQIRQTEAVIHIVRCFEESNISHINENIDPVRDAETIKTEFILKDLDTLEKQRVKKEKLSKSGDKVIIRELEILNRLTEHCNAGHRAKTFHASDNELLFFYSLQLLTQKPILYVANVNDNEITNDNKNENVRAIFNFAKQEGNTAIRICAAIEQEIAFLPEEEKSLFLTEYNLPEPGLNKVIRAGFELLDLHTFFTGGDKQVRAWTIKKGTTAVQAAGKIHTDFVRGFIKADVYHYDELMKYGSEHNISERGLARQEGKSYIVRDGDCIFFKFNT